MSNVDKDTANWRLYGGGGLLLGGILWLFAVILGTGGASDLVKWVSVLGLIIIAIGFLLVGWGQTGSTGAVGNSVLGKVGLWGAALGTLLWALLPVFGTEIVGAWAWIVALLIVVGTLMAAIAIMQKGVARGLAKWLMFAVFIVALVFFFVLFAGTAAATGSVITIIFAIVVTLTGLLYLLNRK